MPAKNDPKSGSKIKTPKRAKPKTTPKASPAGKAKKAEKKAVKGKSKTAKNRKLAGGSATATLTGKSSRAYVDSCIHGLVEKPRSYNGGTPLNKIPVDGQSMAVCLNSTPGLVLSSPFEPGDIADDDTVDVVVQGIDERRQ